MNTRLLIAGFGCRKGCSREELEQLLSHALDHQGLELADLSGLASSVHKRNESGLLALAAKLQLPLSWLSSSDLQPYDQALSERSALSAMYTGSAGVAEASALAQAERESGQPATLIGNKLRSSNATCALAYAPIR